MNPESQVRHLSVLQVTQLFSPAVHDNAKGKNNYHTFSIFYFRERKDRVVVTLQTSSSDIKKVRSYIEQYPVLRTAQSAWHLTSLADLFIDPLPQLPWEASSHTLQLMGEDLSYTYQPPSIAGYSFIRLRMRMICGIKCIYIVFVWCFDESIVTYCNVNPTQLSC